MTSGENIFGHCLMRRVKWCQKSVYECSCSTSNQFSNVTIYKAKDLVLKPTSTKDKISKLIPSFKKQSDSGLCEDTMSFKTKTKFSSIGEIAKTECNTCHTLPKCTTIMSGKGSCHTCECMVRTFDTKFNLISATKIKSPNTKEKDMVNHPQHYRQHPSGVECIDITRHFNFNIGNAIKYLWRAGIKDQKKEIEDLEKAIFYLKDEIKRLEK